MSILDHVSLPVSEFSRGRAFYEQALAPFGVTPLMTFGEACGFGRDGKPDFWIAGPEGKQLPGLVPSHLAFAARSRAEVDAFHRAAIAAGGRDNGAPGLRPQYHPNYYGAFVIDPDGHNIEAVFHGPA
jgi:catechol 2,3-dioxygenase-like lactoylglutathione lyase family enzyme